MLREKLLPYFDADGMIGSKPDPSPHRSGGNQLLETCTAYLLLDLSKEITSYDINKLDAVFRSCEVERGMFDKNPPLQDVGRRADDITHDDLLAVSMASSVFGLRYAADIYDYGVRTGWVMSNNGTNYYTAHAKPWHRAAYMIAANVKPDEWSFATLVISCLLNAFLSMDDSGGKRLTWVILEGTSRKNPLMALVYRIWRWNIKRVLGSLTRIFIINKGEGHPYASGNFIEEYYRNR